LADDLAGKFPHAAALEYAAAAGCLLLWAIVFLGVFD
jgi:hypothetical protein